MSSALISLSRVLAALIFAGLSTVTASAQDEEQAAPQIDISSLRPGDRLEAKLFIEWEPVEYVGPDKTWANSVEVRVPGRSSSRRVSIDEIRIPRGAQTGRADDPFATDEERAQSAGGMRTWTDPSGKFSVDGMLQDYNDRQVTVRRDDGNVITVLLEKLSDEDKKFVADVKSGKLAISPEAAAQKRAKEHMAKVAKTDLGKARRVVLSIPRTWNYEPDPAPESSPLPFAHIQLKPAKDFFDQPKHLFLLPERKQAFVVFQQGHGSTSEYESTVQSCNLTEGTVESSGSFGKAIAPMDMSPDGSLVLARSEGWGWGMQRELTVFKRDGEKVADEAIWWPYRYDTMTGPYATRAHGFRADKQPEDVSWAAFVDSTKLLSMGGHGALVLWDISAKPRPFYLTQNLGHHTPVQLSPGRKYLAAIAEHGITFLQTSDGQVAGLIPLEDDNRSFSQLAFSPDGRCLAISDRDRIRIWDLTSGTLAKELKELMFLSFGRQLTWVGNRHLLVNGEIVVDVESGIPIWRYESMSMSDVNLLHAGRLWYIGGQGHENYVLASAVVPHRAMLDIVDGKSDQEVLIRPGMDVSIQLSVPGGDEAAIREKLVRRMKMNGLNVVPEGKVRLVGSLESGKTVSIQYKDFRKPFDKGSIHQATEQILTLSYQVDGKVAWRYRGKTSPPSLLQLQEGESIDQGLSREMMQDPNHLTSIWIPAYITRYPNDETRGVSAMPLPE